MYFQSNDNLQRGSSIIIDGHQCRIAADGDYLGSRIQLDKDYTGETNLNAIIQVEVTEEAVNANKSKGKKNKAVPVDTLDIQNAVQNLNNLNIHHHNTHLSNLKNDNNKNTKKKKTNTASTTTNNNNNNLVLESNIQSYLADYTSNYQHTVSSTYNPSYPPAPYHSPTKSVGSNASTAANHSSYIPPATEEEQRMLSELRYQELYAQDELERKKKEMYQRLAEQVRNFL